jgi:hypothetical protein
LLVSEVEPFSPSTDNTGKKKPDELESALYIRRKIMRYKGLALFKVPRRMAK